MMKKLFTLFVLIISFVFTIHAQSVEQGKGLMGVTARLGIFNTNAVDKKYSSNSGPGRAGYFQYMLYYEKAKTDRITLGGQFRYNAFILGKDTSATQINVAYSLDLCAYAAFHFVRSEHTDLYIGSALGFSYLKLADNNLNDQGVYKAAGIAYNIDLGGHFYLGDHIGITLTMGYAGYFYPNGTVTGSGGYTDNIRFFMTGSTYGIGLCYKFSGNN